MKLNLFGLFLFTTLFAQSLWRAASDQSRFKPKNQDFNLSNHLTQRQDVQGLNQTFTGHLGEGGDVTRYEKKENLVYSIKGKGKGAIGGGSTVAHHPRDSRSIAFGLVKPSLFATIITAYVTLSWSLDYPL